MNNDGLVLTGDYSLAIANVSLDTEAWYKCLIIGTSHPPSIIQSSDMGHMKVHAPDIRRDSTQIDELIMDGQATNLTCTSTLCEPQTVIIIVINIT